MNVPPPNRLANAVLEAAMAGDWRPLDDYINRGFPLPDSLRQYFRRLLPLAPKPKKRPKLTSVQLTKLKIAVFMWKAKQNGSASPTQDAIEHFQLSRRTIQQANAAFKKLDADARDFILQAIAAKKRPETPTLRPFDDAAPIEGRRATLRRLGRNKASLLRARR